MNKNVLAILAIVILVGVGGGALYLFPKLSKPTPASTTDLTAIQAQIDSGEFATARTNLEQLVASDNTNAEAYFLLGLACFNLQDYQKAREFFARSMELDPGRTAAVHHNLGALAYQTGEMDTAVQEFQAALAIDPNDADSHYQLGATYLLMAFPENAAEPNPENLLMAQTEFEQSLVLVPDKPESLVGLSNVYMFQNKVPDAIELLEKAIEQVPDMSEALFTLGRAYAVVGETEKAKQTLQRFLDTDPPDVWANEAQQLLDQLP
ncbi:MAG: tetratricopeptide repeat protein [Anaerolineae bacterium]|nr:tetratricopeptide repeat protein [Anaerolineae bacterium]